MFCDSYLLFWFCGTWDAVSSKCQYFFPLKIVQEFAEYTVSHLDTYLFGMCLIYSVTPKIGDIGMADPKKPWN